MNIEMEYGNENRIWKSEKNAEKINVGTMRRTVAI